MLTVVKRVRWAQVIAAGIALTIAWTMQVLAMPSQVIIIRHAEKYEDRNNTHLTPKGLTRAHALVEFFRSDPRVIEYGPPAAIIAQSATEKKPAVRCEETVTPLAKSLGMDLITCFTYGQVTELVNWLRSSKGWDGKSVLICAQHMDIVPIVKSLGVADPRQIYWPHETYDRFCIVDFSPSEGKVSRFRNLPQCLLFGDSYQAVSGLDGPDTLEFSQTYREQLPSDRKGTVPASKWSCRIEAVVKGDFSQFDDGTIPVLRLGCFTFGYFATTLGNLRKDPHAEVRINEKDGSGWLKYSYKSRQDGSDNTYAWVSFTWHKESLKVEFWADLDETQIQSVIDMPVELALHKPEGPFSGATNCYVAFGSKKFYAPAGLIYSGIGSKVSGPGTEDHYNASLSASNVILVRRFEAPEK
jgi:hypothetical protein